MDAQAQPAEWLLAPFYLGGKTLGTIWTISHDDQRRFDSEDLRLHQSLSEFASTAFQATNVQAGLKESEERFRIFTAANSDVVYRMSPDWSELRQMIGRYFIHSTSAPMQDWLEQYVDPIDHAHIRARIDEGVRDKKIIELESRVRTMNGKVAWSYSRAIPMFNENNEIVEWIGSGFDITDRRQMIDTLRESEERYRNLFNSMDEGYCIIELVFDEHQKPVDYIFLEVNPSFKKLTGIPDAVGKRMREIAPAHEEHWFEIYGKVALTGEAIRCVNNADALEFRWFDLYAFKVGESSSRKVAVLFKDITQQKNALEALRASEALYRSLFDSMNEGFCIIEVIFNNNNKPVDFRFLEVNPVFERQSGLHDAIGKRMRELVPDHDEYWFDLLGQVALTGKAASLEAEAQAMLSWFNVQAFRIGGEGTTKVAVIFNNITERRNVERKLQAQAEALIEQDRRKNEFLAMLSHELRNPLAPLSNAVILMRLQPDDASVQSQARHIIERQVGQLKSLVDDLLEISRITTGKVLLRFDRVNAAVVMEQSVETTRPLFSLRRQRLAVRIPLDPVWVQADAARLEQVLVNLLTNAAKFTNEGGNIWVEVEQQDNLVIFRICDDGIGISADHLPHIFELFTQADISLDRAQGGLGIGLCLVQRLVELHGGTVEAKSVLGQGSEFIVRLRLLEGDNLYAPDAAPAMQAPVEKVLRILIVDDNIDAAHSLSMLLQTIGHDTQITFDGVCALDASSEYLPDVVLLDIGLPELNGFEVAKQMRRQNGLQNAVLIALTGYGSELDHALSQQAGFDHHLVKPADFKILYKILADLAGKPV